MIKSIKAVGLFIIIFSFKNSSAQLGIGEKINSIKNNYQNENSTKRYEVVDINGNLFQFMVEYDSSKITFSSPGAKKYTDNLPYTCDKIIFEFAGNDDFVEMVKTLNSDWNRIKDGKWSYDNKDKKIKSTAEIQTKDGIKSIVVNGISYGKRNN